MRFLISIFFGWCLTSHKWIARGHLPKPSISARPSMVVPLGENITILCKSEENYLPMKFSLCKVESSRIHEVSSKMTERVEATFHIIHVKPSDEGIYHCIIYSESYQQWSSYSDEVHIKTKEVFYPKPLIWVNPKEVIQLGTDVIIHCKSEQDRQAEYCLWKEGNPEPTQVKTADWEATTFSISTVRLLDGGIYWCEYRRRSSQDHKYSHASDKVYINIIDVSLPKPSIKMSSTEWTLLGLNVTIECQGPEKGLNFSLFKSEKLIASQIEPERQTSEFHVLVMMLENAKKHTCQYHRKGNPFVWSEPSDPLELVKIDRFSITMWAGVAAGILLVFLLLLLLLIFYKKRRKGSTASDRNQPVNMLQEPEAGEDPNEVCYTVLNLHSLEIKQAADLTTNPEFCVYASVTKKATKMGP